jgi:hypothetical protein
MSVHRTLNASRHWNGNTEGNGFALQWCRCLRGRVGCDGRQVSIIF